MQNRYELERMIFASHGVIRICGFTQSAEHGFSLVKILGYIGMYLSIDEGEITNVAVFTGNAVPWHYACCLRKQKRGREPLGRQNRA